MHLRELLKLGKSEIRNPNAIQHDSACAGAPAPLPASCDVLFLKTRRQGAGAPGFGLRCSDFGLQVQRLAPKVRVALQWLVDGSRAVGLAVSMQQKTMENHE